MLCISHPYFLVGNIKVLLEPFLKFVEMFSCERLISDKVTGKKFYSSISIVVTKSQWKMENYLMKIKNTIRYL